MADPWEEAMLADYADFMAAQGHPVTVKKQTTPRTSTKKTNKRKVRYARVPSGVETCQFCVMLASRGFVYSSEVNASHSHSHCDCVVTPGFTNETVVEGYDPDMLYDQYLEARKAVEAMFTPEDWMYVGGATRTKLILQEMRREVKEKQETIERNKPSVSKNRYPTSQDEIDDILSNELAGLNTPVRVTYNPRIKTDGKMKSIEIFPGFIKVEKIEIGKQSKEGRDFLIDTIIHEMLEARIAERAGDLFYSGEDAVHEYIERVIAKYVRMKGL